MKTRKEIEAELSTLKKKVASCDNKTVGRFTALEWMLGSPSDEAKHKASGIELMLTDTSEIDPILTEIIEMFPTLAEINEPESMLAEIQLYKGVGSKIKTRKEIESQISMLKGKLPLYSLLSPRMTPSQKSNAGMSIYGDEHPIAKIIGGMIMALEWGIRSHSDEKKLRAMRSSSLNPDGTSKPHNYGIKRTHHKEVYRKPRSDVNLDIWRRKG